MKSKRATIAFVLIAATAAFAATKPFFKPKDGFVPDARTAIAIAVAIWKPVYGEESIEREKPYHAKLIDGVWHVDGSLPDHVLGGVAHAEIAKEDGRVLDMWRSQ